MTPTASWVEWMLTLKYRQKQHVLILLWFTFEHLGFHLYVIFNLCKCRWPLDLVCSLAPCLPLLPGRKLLLDRITGVWLFVQDFLGPMSLVKALLLILDSLQVFGSPGQMCHAWCRCGCYNAALEWQCCFWRKGLGISDHNFQVFSGLGFLFGF